MRLELTQKLNEGLHFDIGIVDTHLVPSPFGDCAEVGQPQMGGGASVDRQAKPGIDQRDAQRYLQYRTSVGQQLRIAGIVKGARNPSFLNLRLRQYTTGADSRYNADGESLL